jgi:hypothetical protein
LARLRTWLSRQPCKQPYHIQGDGGEEMLEMDFGLPDVPCMPQITKDIDLEQPALRAREEKGEKIRSWLSGTIIITHRLAGDTTSRYEEAVNRFFCY